MSILTLLYDPACGLCRRVQGWLAEQPKLIELRMIPIKTDAAKKRFPIGIVLGAFSLVTSISKLRADQHRSHPRKG